MHNKFKITPDDFKESEEQQVKINWDSVVFRYCF